jgi:hypothetical protein
VCSEIGFSYVVFVVVKMLSVSHMADRASEAVYPALLVLLGFQIVRFGG